MGWVSLELCGPLVTLKACDWFGTDRSHQPHTYRVAPSLWHKALAVASTCGWAAATWVFLSPGRIHPTATKITNLPLLKATWGHSVYWQVHLAPIPVPSTGLEGILEVLTKFTQQGLKCQPVKPVLTEHRNASNEKKPPCKIRWPWTFLLPCKKVPVPLCKQSIVCSDLMSQRGVSSSISHKRAQVISLNDPTPSPGSLINQWFRSRGSWWKKLLLILGITILISVFSCMYLYGCCGICPQCSQTDAQGATSMLVTPPDECSEPVLEEGAV